MDYKCNIKVGSKVVCVKSPLLTYYGAGWEEGKVFTVDRITKDMRDEEKYIAWPKYGCGIYTDCLSLANIIPDDLFTI